MFDIILREPTALETWRGNHETCNCIIAEIDLKINQQPEKISSTSNQLSLINIF